MICLAQEIHKHLGPTGIRQERIERDDMHYTMIEQDARAALSAMGITPTKQLIENWLRAESAEEEL